MDQVLQACEDDMPLQLLQLAFRQDKSRCECVLQIILTSIFFYQQHTMKTNFLSHQNMQLQVSCIQVVSLRCLSIPNAIFLSSFMKHKNNEGNQIHIQEKTIKEKQFCDFLFAYLSLLLYRKLVSATWQFKLWPPTSSQLHLIRSKYGKTRPLVNVFGNCNFRGIYWPDRRYTNG